MGCHHLPLATRSRREPANPVRRLVRRRLHAARKDAPMTIDITITLTEEQVRARQEDLKRHCPGTGPDEMRDIAKDARPTAAPGYLLNAAILDEDLPTPVTAGCTVTYAGGPGPVEGLAVKGDYAWLNKSEIGRASCRERVCQSV